MRIEQPVTRWLRIADLQSIPGDLKYKAAAAMLAVQTREANEECFVIGIQHGRHDVTCNSIDYRLSLNDYH